MKDIHDKVYNFKTKNKEGFINTEIERLLKDYPDINMDKFNDALMGETCMMIDNEMVIYRCDIYNALLCGIQNRGLSITEFD